MRELFSDYPLFLKLLLTNVFKTNDEIKQFMFKVLNQIPLFKDLKVDLFHKIMYSFKQVVVEKNEFIVRKGTHSNFMFIVMNGELQAASDIDSKKFVFESLGQGSIVNHNNFLFVDELVQVDIQAVKRSHIMVLPISLFNLIVEGDSELERRVNNLMNRVIKRN